jgi:hypothetical protein
MFRLRNFSKKLKFTMYSLEVESEPNQMIQREVNQWTTSLLQDFTFKRKSVIRDGEGAP